MTRDQPPLVTRDQPLSVINQAVSVVSAPSVLRISIMIGRAARGGESSEDDGGRGGPHNINYQGRCFCKCGEHKIDHLSKKV